MDIRRNIIQSVLQMLHGKVENWNERIMIPAMFAMIKSQKEQLDRQEKLINQLYKKLNIEKEN